MDEKPTPEIRAKALECAILFTETPTAKLTFNNRTFEANDPKNPLTLSGIFTVAGIFEKYIMTGNPQFDENAIDLKIP